MFVRTQHDQQVTKWTRGLTDSDLLIKANKTANDFTGMQKVSTAAGIGSEAYLNSQIQAIDVSSGTGRAQYGFHNAGRNGGALYLDTDGFLKWVNNTGDTYIISWTK